MWMVVDWWWCIVWAGVAGGLTNLSKLPACNVLVIGAQKRTLSGFSTKAIMPHTGFVYYCEIVQRTPPVIITSCYSIVSDSPHCLCHTDWSIVFARWRQCDPHLIYGSSGSTESATQMAPGLFQPFLQGSRSWPADRPQYICSNS